VAMALKIIQKFILLSVKMALYYQKSPTLLGNMPEKRAKNVHNLLRLLASLVCILAVLALFFVGFVRTFKIIF
jgi:hypothetical protein